jgi:ABC-2 type transport system ATP-binding protein
VVVRDISFDVREGETFGLIGLNGAGKTTLLKTILGLKSQKSGVITVGGHVSGSSDAGRCFAFLPERFDPPWFLNAYEFIDFTLSLYSKKIERAQIDKVANHLGLNTAFLPKKAQSYSKGMRQKLGLMATFLTGCPLLILDEPMSGLDPLARAQVKSMVAEAKLQGRTVFLSSHILSDMEELCDRIAILHGGQIMFIGKPSEVLAKTGCKTLEDAFLNLTGLHATLAA